MDVGEVAEWQCRPPSGTRPHLNNVSLGVEVGGPQTLGGRDVAGATATSAAVEVLLLLASCCDCCC
jgi:hypothetical protein